MFLCAPRNDKLRWCILWTGAVKKPSAVVLSLRARPCGANKRASGSGIFDCRLHEAQLGGCMWALLRPRHMCRGVFVSGHLDAGPV